MEPIQTTISVLALLISGLALWLSRRNWQESNRPIVVASVRTAVAGELAIAYDLVVVNGGNRPAACITMTCDEKVLAAGIQGSEDDPLVRKVYACFKPGAQIPVLLPGEAISNSFGTTGVDATWIVGATVPILVAYRDLAGKAYRDQVELVVRDSSSFAGGSWGA